MFPKGRIEALTIQRDGEPLARLLGTSCDTQHALRPNDFAPDAAGLYTIAVAHGDADTNTLQARGIHLWALGGRHGRSTPLGGDKIERFTMPEGPGGYFAQGGSVPYFAPMIHYCGSPQGRCPEQSGVHGCTLVQVDAQRQAHTCLIPTDAARWHDECVLVDDATSREDLESRLRQRVHALIGSVGVETGDNSNLPERPGGGFAQMGAAPFFPPALISWTIAGQGPIVAQLQRGSLAAELLHSLRNDYGYRSPPAWSVSLQTESSETLPPEWYEQETIRGDFLRAVRQLQMNPDEPLTLDAFVSEPHLAGALAAAAMVPGGVAGQRVLREAAALGVRLLSGEEAQT